MADKRYDTGYATICYPIVIPYEEIEDVVPHTLDYIHPDGTVTHDLSVNVYLKTPEIRFVCANERDQEHLERFFKKTKFTIIQGAKNDKNT